MGESLVRDGERPGGPWSRGHELHSRISSTNRQISQKSAQLRAESKQLAETLRSESSSGAADYVDQLRAGLEPPNWPNCIASKTLPLYQSSYDRFYGLKQEPHMATAVSRAKVVRGHELTSTITSWGS